MSMWAWLALAAAGLGAWAFVVLRARPEVPARAEFRAMPPAEPVPLRPAAAPAARALPPELAAFAMGRAEQIEAERAQAYVTMFRNVPRPPKLLHHLLSPDFVRDASSAQLVDLIVMEPLICANVLKAVNSPLYALATPVSSIQQAVTFLGLDTVRLICLRYILIATFKADSDERARAMNRLWLASALAAALAEHLAQALVFDDRASLVSGVTLSFLGRVATVATMPKGLLVQMPEGSFLERTRWEQDKLGLPASEIGRLLMRHWGLPERLVAEAGDIDRVLVTPPPARDDEQHSRLALGYLAVRLGERLALDADLALAALDLSQSDPDLHHLQSHLAQPRLARLPSLLQSPELTTALQAVRANMQGARAAR